MANRKETVVIICHENPFTSFGRMASLLKRSLLSDYDVEIVWLVTPKHFPSPMRLPPDSHTIHAKNFITGRLTFGRQLRRSIRNMRPSMIILINQFTGFLIPAIRKELPAVRVGVFIHDVFAETGHPSVIKRAALRRIYNSHITDADVFLYNSGYTKSEAQRILKLPTTPTSTVVGFPIDRTIFRPIEISKKNIRQKYDLDNYKGMCLNVSFDNPRKNIKTFFELAKARPDIAFVRLGRISPWMKEWLTENRVNNVLHFSGLSTEQLPELYCCADLLIFPSFAEGFGVPPLEALACGVPAVAASGSALEEIFKDAIPLIDPPDNVSGYLEIIDDVMVGKNIVNKKNAESLIEYYSIEKFGNRVRSCFKPYIDRMANIQLDNSNLSRRQIYNFSHNRFIQFIRRLIKI